MSLHEKNSKHEIRNPKQFQMVKNQKIFKQTRLGFRDWDLNLSFVSDFDIRISDFVCRWLAAINIVQVVLLNMNVRM